jgi:hypothetical protein
MSDVRLNIFVLLYVTAQLCISLPARADDDDKCDAGLFLYQVDRLPDWHALQEFHAKPSCPDEDVFSLAYSDLVVRTLAEHWSGVGELKKVMASDPEFGAFVFKHIDYQGTRAQLTKTVSNATTSCPPGDASLCQHIATLAQAALTQKKPRQPAPAH